VILALSIVVPAVTSALVTLLMTAAGNVRGSTSSDYMILLNLLNAVEPALVAISICLGVFSLLPATRAARTFGPARHPVDSQGEE